MTIDSTGVKFWNGTGWITPTKGAKGLPGPKGPIGPSLTPITSFANRDLTVRNVDVITNPGALDNGAWRNRSDGNAGTAAVSWITGGSGGPPKPGGGNYMTWARKKWSVAANASMTRNGFEIYNGPTASDWIPLIPGSNTTVSMYVRVIGVYPREMRLALINAQGTSLGSVQLTLTSNLWQKISFSFVVPAGSTGARVICEAATVAQGGTPWNVNDQLDETAASVITDGEPNVTPVDNVFILSNKATRPNEVSPPITPFTAPNGEQYYEFVNQMPWAYWVNVYFNAGVALTDTTHISIWREDNSGGAGQWTELNRSQAPLQEAGWAVSAVVIKMAGPDRLIIRGYSYKAISNYKAWMTISPIGPVYL